MTDRILRFAIGALFGALMLIALSSALAKLPVHFATSVVMLVFGSSLVFALTADNLRRSAGRCLLMLGCVLMLLPVLSIILMKALEPAASSAKSDLGSAAVATSSVQTVAALIAFAAGAAVIVIGVVLVSGRLQSQQEFVEDVLEAALQPEPSGIGKERFVMLAASVSRLNSDGPAPFAVDVWSPQPAAPRLAASDRDPERLGRDEQAA